MSVRVASRGRDVWTTLAAGVIVPNAVRLWMLRRCGAKIGNSCIEPGARFLGGVNLTVEDLVFINHGCLFDAPGQITIRRNAAIGPRVSFLTASHHLGSSESRAGTSYTQPIEVGIGCWIGADVTILPGVTIGGGCVVAAGAVVTDDCEPDTLYAGVPARAVRRLEDQVPAEGFVAAVPDSHLR
jgi:maltose O-acetyltransferase